MVLMDPVNKLSFVGPIYARRLEKLDINSIGDLLHHVPHRYEDYSQILPISRARIGDTLTLVGDLTFIKNQYTKSGKKIQIATLKDPSGEIALIWFNQPYLVRILYKGDKLSVSGKIDWFGKVKALISPEYEKVFEGKERVHTGRILPIYPETSGISSKWLRGKIKEAYVKTEDNLEEFLPESLLNNLKLQKFRTSVHDVHFPEKDGDAEKGKERLAFNELLFLHLKSCFRKTDWRKTKVAYKLKIDTNEIEKFVKSLPFILTTSQDKSIKEILADLGSNIPMNRLLEGDVGSGKTVVAATGAFSAFLNGSQTIFMAPTQILAQQHFMTLKKLLEPYKVRISLITSEGIKADPGRNDIFVGTHALLNKKGYFDNVSLVVIDEQHRFGVEQRANIVKVTRGKKVSPHILTMTATPIPRTIALSLYGDLDLSTLDELPGGRIPIVTWIVPPTKRYPAYSWIDKQIVTNKVQVFIICPLIEESEVETLKTVKAVTQEYENLKKVFPKRRLGLLHGKQSPGEKNKVLARFEKREIDILVSTPVVEVGIDFPNATIMLIEAAERFGLAALHQLRGRVGRGSKKSYCLLFTDSKSPKVLTRLKALESGMSGFELAELDLKLRGPGEVFGTKQHGFHDLKIASWNNFEMIKLTKVVAEETFKNPEKYSLLIEKLKKMQVIPN
jgi:ATP-dependent DNA helicase RecG